MNKLILLCPFVLSHFLSAQEQIATYEMATFEHLMEELEEEWGKEPFSIEATPPEEGRFTFFIDMNPLGPYNKLGGIILESEKIELFHSFLKECQNKLEEWDAIADSNKVEFLFKDMPISSTVQVEGYWWEGGWKYDENVALRPKYWRRNNISHLWIYTDEMISRDNSNDFFEQGFVFAFSSGEIDDILSVLTTEKVSEYFSSNSPKKSLDDLFK